MPRHFLHRTEREKSSLSTMKTFFLSMILKSLLFIPAFAEWQVELKNLEKKIEKSEDDQERLEEL